MIDQLSSSIPEQISTNPRALASIWQRGSAFVIDWVLLVLVWAIIVTGILLAGGTGGDLVESVATLSVFGVLFLAEGNLVVENPLFLLLLVLPVWGAFALTWAVYDFALTWAFGKTAGKAVVGIEVVQQNGQRRQASTIALRSFLKGFLLFLPFLNILMLFTIISMIVAQKDRRAIQDLVAKTDIMKSHKAF